MNPLGRHCSALSAASPATSGMPVAAPALSAQVFIVVVSELNNEFPPTIASAFLQESICAFFDSPASILVSHVFTTTLRHANPPLLFKYFANAWIASMFDWNRPGASGEPVSAATSMTIWSAVTPVSVAWSVVPVQSVPAVVEEPPPAAVVVDPAAAAVVADAAAAAVDGLAALSGDLSSRLHEETTSPAASSPNSNLFLTCPP